MAFKRILGVLAVRDGRLVKSYGYRLWRPAGGLVTALRNLDRWGTDEIVLLDISRRTTLDPEVLQQIRTARVATPLAYGGGIRHVDDVSRLLDVGCDRFVVESLLFNAPETVHRLADLAGRQALIASLPLVKTGSGGPAIWRPDGLLPFADWRERLCALPVSEYFVTAVETEGREGSFPKALPECLAGFPAGSVIWFGGLDLRSARACLALPETVGVAWGNLLHERELAVPLLRRRLGRINLRSVRLA
jgi:cyclase